MAGSKAQGRHDDLGQANAIGDLTCETWLEDELHGASDGKKTSINWRLQWKTSYENNHGKIYYIDE